MKKGAQIIQMVGAVLLLVGAMLQITRWELSPYIYTLGAVMFAYIQVMSRYDGKNLIIRRLRRQQIIGAVLLVFAGVLMFVTCHNEWVLCLSAAAVIQLYTAFRIPSELEKEKR
jgi:drug/metabolite transporter (DMT)-like permease